MAHTHQLNLNEYVNKPVTPGKLFRNGGISPEGEQIGFTSFYMTRNDAPVIPIVGEFHYARYSCLQWEEELLKIKAGGVRIIATYVFWIYHEEVEGVFEWGGDRSLRHFIDLCSKHELLLLLRIGPFCHGEVRNGGIPDWVFSKPLEIRSNDPQYLLYAKRLYREIARQVKGGFFQEGGPIIGIQLENEYMHAGAPYDAWGYKSGVFISRGRDGNLHMAELRRIAEECGMRPLFYTATAWGGAAVPGTDTLPMLAGYAYTPWIPNQPPSREFVFRSLHEEPMEEVGYDSPEYPVAYCEMAGGMQVSYHARPYVDPRSIEAMTLVKLGSGSNLLGYYMYHGGSNPQGKHGYLNEAALPKITYDYQAPLGEFGQAGASYGMIRSLSMLLDSFGSLLAPMGTVLPEEQSGIAPEDSEPLRWCVRQTDGRGFLFLNNFQDHLEMPDRDGIRIELHTPHGTAAFPRQGTMGLKSGTAAVLPFMLRLEGVELISATVQPLTQLKTEEGEPLLVFYAHDGLEPELVLSKNSVSRVVTEAGRIGEDKEAWILHPAAGKAASSTLTLVDGSIVRLLVLTRREALNAYLLPMGGRERLFISECHLYMKREQLICTSPSASRFSISVFPAVPGGLTPRFGGCTEGQDGLFKTYTLELPEYEPSAAIRQPAEHAALMRMDTEWPEHVEDVFLEIGYDGDVAGLYLEGRLVTDHIHYGDLWRIGLKGIRDELKDRELFLNITPLRKGTVHAYVNQAYVERFEGVEIAAIHRIKAVPHYRTALTSGARLHIRSSANLASQV